jgi:quinoprotein glucose dehydrogenase
VSETGPTVFAWQRSLAMLVVSAAVASAHAAAPSTVWDGVYTAEQAKRGEAAYVKDCASCHKDHLLGDDDYVNPLIGPVFMARWNNKSVGDLYEKTKTTMPADYPDTLKPQDYVDITSYVLSASGFPAGRTELPPDLAALKLITFTQARPK